MRARVSVDGAVALRVVERDMIEATKTPASIKPASNETPGLTMSQPHRHSGDGFRLLEAESLVDVSAARQQPRMARVCHG